MKLSILLPTLGTREDELIRLFNSLENQTNKLFELILISQGNHNFINNKLKEYTFRYKHIEIDKIGLSYARNIGMNYVDGNYLILSDDDAWYPEFGVEEIINKIETNNEEVICFKIYDPLKGVFYKNYKKHKENVTTRELLRKSSIEIGFNLDKIDKSKIVFNENVGLGTKYNSGEENLLMNKLKKEGVKIKFVDKEVVYHEIKDASDIDLNFIHTKAVILKEILGKINGLIFLNLILIKNRNKITKISKHKAFLESYKIFLNNKIRIE